MRQVGVLNHEGDANAHATRNGQSASEEARIGRAAKTVSQPDEDASVDTQNVSRQQSNEKQRELLPSAQTPNLERTSSAQLQVTNGWGNIRSAALALR
jgi:hypothetical protein